MLKKYMMKILVLFGTTLMVIADLSIQETREIPQSSLAELLRSHSQTLEEPLKRIRKSASTGDNCNTWSSWINEHIPTSVDKSENESLSHEALSEFCPPSAYGKITEVECKDDENNIFIGEREDVDHQYHINCDDKNKTVECAPNRDDFLQCPDLSIRYFCSCALPNGYDAADKANSEDVERILEDTMIIKQFVPLQCSLVVLIILCLVIIALLCKKRDGLQSKSKLVNPL